MQYKVTLYATSWTEVVVEASSRDEAIDKAYGLRIPDTAWIRNLEPTDQDVEVVESINSTPLVCS